MIADAMDSEAVEPPERVAERFVERKRVSAAQLSLVLSRTAAALEGSAVLADAHAERLERSGRSGDAAEERRVAGRAREDARRARSRSKQLAAGEKP
jgi:hypothetical protein